MSPASLLPTLYQKLTDHPDQTVTFVALNGTVLVRSFAEMHADVLLLMERLRAGGLGAGDLVGLLGPNSYQWAIADLALLGLRCVSVAVPVEGRISTAEVDEIVERYQLSAALVTLALPAGTQTSSATVILEDDPVQVQAIARSERAPIPPEVVTVAFSSGTAGTRKGLMLTDAGIVNTIEVSADAWRVRPDDNILIVMPFSNFQQRYLLYLAIWTGCAASVVPPARMLPMLRKLEPTIILGPPSFFELVPNRVHAGDLRSRLPYHLAAAVHAVLPGRWARPITTRLGRRWTSMYGSRVRLMLTGSAPVQPQMVTLFQQLGAPLFEIYGSTESGWIAFNLPGHSRPGATGRPVRGVDVQLGDDGEVILRCVHPQAVGYVFEGTESQATVFRPDGRIATGDVGHLDRSGFLRLTGRKKNVIITRSGVKISPEALESSIESGCPGVRAVVVSPANDGLLTGVVWLEDGDDRADRVRAHIDDLNRKNQAWQQIAEVVVRPAGELSVQSGLLTRNLKIDRSAVMRTVFDTIGGGRR